MLTSTSRVRAGHLGHALAAVTLALVAAGCGGKNGSAPTSGLTLPGKDTDRDGLPDDVEVAAVHGQEVRHFTASQQRTEPVPVLV